MAAGWLVRALQSLLETQRPHLALWSPVLFGSGIGLYFALPAEPGLWMLAALLVAATLGAATMTQTGALGRMVILALILPASGLGLATFRTLQTEAPVLAKPANLTAEGRVIGLDRSGSGRPRALLDRVVLYGVGPAQTPAQIRVSLDPETPAELLEPGVRLVGYFRLSPPAAPAEPGGFDFRRHAWYRQIGAVGYGRSPVLEAAPSGHTDWRQRVFALRITLSRAIQARMPEQSGGFAAAVLAGDRSAVDPKGIAALRASNLAHLLAISGLHMGLLSGFVFALVRYGLAAVPQLALRFPTKKIAAALTLAAAGFYLLLSGMNVATQRAFIMTAVILVAVILDRPAFTLRSVALAAFAVLLIKPESLTEAGFQMSFAATTALIAVYQHLRRQPWWQATQYDRRWRFLRPVIGVAMTSAVAGAATAPFSAFHFNVISQYGLLANILAVPAMGLLVMPAAVAAALLAPLGLAALPLQGMHWGIVYILEVAEFVAGLEGAVRAVHTGPVLALALITLGGLLLAFWVGRGRVAGFLPVLVGLMLWASADRPEILVSSNGRLFGIDAGGGRVLNSDRGNSFTARSWLANDGDRASQEAAFGRPGMERSRGRARMEVPGLGLFAYVGSKAPDETTAGLCTEAAVLLAPGWWQKPDGPCRFIGARRLRRDGALAISLAEGYPRFSGAKALNRSRPWTQTKRVPTSKPNPDGFVRVSSGQ